MKKITETNTSGGTAAETENINSKNKHSEMTRQNQPDGTAEGTVMLKDAASKFQCVTGSLKNNIKSGKLSAFQENSKAPYRVHPTEVERFLRNSPGIASIFHPKAVTTSTTGKSHTQAAAKEVVQKDGLVRATEAVVENSDNKNAGQATPKESEDKQTAAAKKPRRRRRRGKGGTSQQHAPIATPHILKSLAGISTEKRLFITAFLSELTSLVASA